MDQRIIDLYDKFTHGGSTAASSSIGWRSLPARPPRRWRMLPLLQNDYARAETISRRTTHGSSRTRSTTAPCGRARGLHGAPKGQGKAPGGDRGAREPRPQSAYQGYCPAARARRLRRLRGRSAVGGWRHAGRRGQGPRHDRQARSDARPRNASPRPCAFFERAPGGNGKAGAIGFCWGGGMVNRVAVLSPDSKAAVAYYGAQPPAADVAKIQAPLLLHYAGLDKRINAGIPAYEAALKANTRRTRSSSIQTSTTPSTTTRRTVTTRRPPTSPGAAPSHS